MSDYIGLSWVDTKQRSTVASLIVMGTRAAVDMSSMFSPSLKFSEQDNSI